MEKVTCTAWTSNSPRAWGWTVDRSTGLPGPAEFPTRVGMDRVELTNDAGGWRIPHARGDGPGLHALLGLFQANSPRAWGWTAASRVLGLGRMEFPTRVGMDRIPGPSGSKLIRIPHARGDGPLVRIVDGGVGLNSPRAWGWTEGSAVRFQPAVEFPTRVGMDRLTGTRTCPHWRIPHARGDGPAIHRELDAARANSPRAWGWTGYIENLADFDANSPRAWGWTELGPLYILRRSEFPTRVGMDRQQCCRAVTAYRIPHARGDGPLGCAIS